MYSKWIVYDNIQIKNFIIFENIVVEVREGEADRESW